MKKEINIYGTTFLLDLIENNLQEKGRMHNKISFDDMIYAETHYFMRDNINTKNIPEVDELSGNHIVKATVPQKVQMDPTGMARKYGFNVTALEGKTDFDILVDQAKYKERVERCQLPLIDIAGQSYFVDLRLKELRLQSDSNTQIDLKDKYDALIDEYCFFFRPAKLEVVEIDLSSTKLPKGVVLVEIPGDRKLDPVSVARANRYDMKDFLIKYPFMPELKATITPLKNTMVAEIVKQNREPLLTKNPNTPRKTNGLGL